MATSLPREFAETQSAPLAKGVPLALANKKVLKIAICAFLALIVLIAFGRALGNGFVNYDDSEYVYDNPRITDGISFGGIIWAFTHVHAANWHPLTTISHMVDVQLYGLQPWGHHLTNILLHATAVILLFLALCRLTTSAVAGIGDAGRDQRSRLQLYASAFVAALFAIHPLRVESVAWISERKDVLSGVFFMLTLLAYARYARSERRFVGKYLLVVLFFALGLMCKPTLVTVPFVLLLLDYWPLQRIHSTAHGLNISTLRSLVVEKIPFFVLSAASCFATVVAQQKVIAANLKMGLTMRVANAAQAYVAYLAEMLFPSHLVVSHPYTEHIKVLPFVSAAALLLLITILAVIYRRRFPFLLVGWLWYLGVLVPMIGLVQVGSQSRADRYTYLSQIGIYLIVAWSAAAIVSRFRLKRLVVGVPAVAVILLLVFCSFVQARYWHDTESLWRHALDAQTYDYIAHDSLGYALLQKGQIDDAVSEYRKALEIKPDYADSHNNLGNVLLQQGKISEAVEHYNRALKIDPNFPEPHNNLGNVYFKQNRVDEAIDQYRIAVAGRSDFSEPRYNLGVAYIVKGDWGHAISCLRAAIDIDPKYAQAHNKLGIALGATGEIDQALSEFRRAVFLDPKYAEAHFNLGYVLAHSGKQREAIEHYLKAVHLRPDYPEAKHELRELGVPVGR